MKYWILNEYLYVNCFLFSFLEKMGRGFIVEDAVEGYLSNLCKQPTGPTTGLLIGQVQHCHTERKTHYYKLYHALISDYHFSFDWLTEKTVIDNTDKTFQNSAQRDIVVMATRTPQRQESGRDFVDKEWVCEHARQVGLYPKTLFLTIEIVCLVWHKLPTLQNW